MSKRVNKSTMPPVDKMKEVNEKIEYILKQYDCRLQIQLQPANWFSKTFQKKIKINSGVVILPNTVPQPPVQPSK